MQILDNCWNTQAKHIISFIKNNEKLHCLPLFRIRTTLQDTLALTLHCIPCSLAGTPEVVFHSQPAQCNREQDHTLPAVRDTFPCRVPNFSTLGCILLTPQVKMMIRDEEVISEDHGLAFRVTHVRWGHGFTMPWHRWLY